jgi:hypothetical protein
MSLFISGESRNTSSVTEFGSTSADSEDTKATKRADLAAWHWRLRGIGGSSSP